MQYEQLETDIVNKLAPGLPGVSVLALPEVQTDFNKGFKIGKITVAYKGSKYGAPRSMNQLSQLETAEFELIIQARVLRGANGVYAFMEGVKRLILGYRLTDTDKVYLVDQMLIVAEGANVEAFTFSMSVACTLLVGELNAAPDDYGDTIDN